MAGGESGVHLSPSVVILEDVCFDGVPFGGFDCRAEGMVFPARTSVVGEVGQGLDNADWGAGWDDFLHKFVGLINLHSQSSLSFGFGDGFGCGSGLGTLAN